MLHGLQAITIAIIGSAVLVSGALVVTLGRGSSGYGSIGGLFILLGFVVAFVAAAQASLARASSRDGDRAGDDRDPTHGPEPRG